MTANQKQMVCREWYIRGAQRAVGAFAAAVEEFERETWTKEQILEEVAFFLKTLDRHGDELMPNIH